MVTWICRLLRGFVVGCFVVSVKAGFWVVGFKDGFADVGLTVGLGVGCNSTMHCNHEKIKHLQFIPLAPLPSWG